ncbi:MAG: hypothetical protein A4E19_09110 [Nitrospira sp. SG-bin1]|nr:MAG: hypothetical protein A4E19_09110 [Nitrospira sp. SG-bin1]
MPMTRLIGVGSRWTLVVGYVLLVLTLHPLLLEHTFAAGTSHEHSDQDVCAWLDHAASAGLHSVTPPPVLLPVIVAPPSRVEVAFRYISRPFDSVRGPPSFSS